MHLEILQAFSESTCRPVIERCFFRFRQIIGRFVFLWTSQIPGEKKHKHPSLADLQGLIEYVSKVTGSTRYISLQNGMDFLTFVRKIGVHCVVVL